jgi:hypothetical protein
MQGNGDAKTSLTPERLLFHDDKGIKKMLLSSDL